MLHLASTEHDYIVRHCGGSKTFQLGDCNLGVGEKITYIDATTEVLFQLSITLNYIRAHAGAW